MPALLPLILANLPGIIAAGESVVQFATRTKQILNQSNEWTEQHEQEFVTLLLAEAQSAAWATDGK